MKYVLMYTSTPELMADVPAERQQEVYQAIYGWFGKYADSFADGGAELQESTTATSVKSGPTDGATGAAPVVVDAPFSEAKESIGGFSVVDVPDLDSAIAMAKEWPMLAFPGVAVEIRPIVDHADDMPM